MATGWAKDGAVQEQIDASVADAVRLARSKLKHGEGRPDCEECGAEISLARQQAVPGVRTCVPCQELLDAEETSATTINRRGSKDSQLR